MLGTGRRVRVKDLNNGSGCSMALAEVGKGMSLVAIAVAKKRKGTIKVLPAVGEKRLASMRIYGVLKYLTPRR